MTLKTPKPWDCLPNAKHIDLVLSHATEYNRYLDKAHGVDWYWAWDQTLDRLKEDHNYWKYIIWCDIGQRIDDDNIQMSNGVFGICMALIAYDDCAYMLDSEPNELAVMAKLGDDRATLILPWCNAIKEVFSKEKQHVEQIY